MGMVHISGRWLGRNFSMRGCWGQGYRLRAKTVPENLRGCRQGWAGGGSSNWCKRGKKVDAGIFIKRQGKRGCLSREDKERSGQVKLPAIGYCILSGSPRLGGPVVFSRDASTLLRERSENRTMRTDKRIHIQLPMHRGVIVACLRL